MPEKTVELNEGQSVALNTDARFVALIAGTGGGKTFFGPIWLYNEISKYPGDDWMVVAPTHSMLRRTTRRDFLKFFSGTQLEGTFKEVKGVYELPCGGNVYFCSANNPNTLEGGQIRGAWLDEAGQMVRWTWVVIQARLGLKQGRCLVTTTPYGMNWLFHEYYKQAEVHTIPIGGGATKTQSATAAEFFAVQFPSILNPHYHTAEFERMKTQLTESEFRMRYMGTFEQLSGLVYPFFRTCVAPQFTYATKREDDVIGGIDPGWSDKFACITSVYGGDSVLHLRRELYQSQKVLREIAMHLDRSSRYYCDPAARREIEELSDLGIDVRPGTNDVRPGIMKVNEYIMDLRLDIPEELFPNLISEADFYVFEQGKDKPSDKTPHHLLDALRYMVMGLEDSSDVEIFFV